MSIEAVSITDLNTFDLMNNQIKNALNTLPFYFLRDLVPLITQYSLPFSRPICAIKKAEPVDSISIVWTEGEACLLLYSKRPRAPDLLLIASPESEDVTPLILDQNLEGRCRYITTDQRGSFFFLHGGGVSHYSRSGNNLYKLQTFDFLTYFNYDRASNRFYGGTYKRICTWRPGGIQLQEFPLDKSNSSFIFEAGGSQLVVHKQSPYHLNNRNSLVISIDDWTPTVRATLLEWECCGSEYCVSNFVVDPTHTFLFVGAMYSEYTKPYCGRKKTFKSSNAICMVYNLKDFSKITTLHTKRKCHKRRSWWDMRAAANPQTIGLLSTSLGKSNEATIDLWHTRSWLHLTTIEIRDDLHFTHDIFFELGNESVIVVIEGSNDRPDSQFHHSVILFDAPKPPSNQDKK